MRCSNLRQKSSAWLSSRIKPRTQKRSMSAFWIRLTLMDETQNMLRISKAVGATRGCALVDLAAFGRCDACKREDVLDCLLVSSLVLLELVEDNRDGVGLEGAAEASFSGAAGC